MKNADDYILSSRQNVAFYLLEHITRTENNEISDEDLLTLQSIFGPVLKRALNIFEKYPELKSYSTHISKQRLVELKGTYNRCYRIFPRINFCSCYEFKHRVMVAKSQITCKHILAARIAIVLHKVEDQRVDLYQYRKLVESMFDIEV